MDRLTSPSTRAFGGAIGVWLSLVSACAPGAVRLPDTMEASGAGGSGHVASACSAAPDPIAETALMTTLASLASPSLAGRAPGTVGDASARALIEERFRCLGLEAPDGAFQQPFTTPDGARTANVVGVLRGADPEVGGDIIVVAAHHDHLGESEAGIHLGANDDASGVAAVLGIAERLIQQGRAPRRTIAFAVFGAEEAGFLGSRHYAAHPPGGLSLEDTVFMLNLDMIGRYGAEDRLYALHTFPGTPGRTLLEGLLGDFPELDVVLGEPGEEADHLTFCDAGVPVAFFFTPDDACYHRPCDTPGRIDRGPYARTVALALALVSEAADGELDLAAARMEGCGEP